MNNLARKERLKNIKESIPFYILILPAVVIVFLMNYLPIYGVLISFQDFMPGDKIFSDTTVNAISVSLLIFILRPSFYP